MGFSPPSVKTSSRRPISASASRQNAIAAFLIEKRSQRARPPASGQR
jgi:hypothetical protein